MNQYNKLSSIIFSLPKANVAPNFLLYFFLSMCLCSCKNYLKTTQVGNGWSNNSINTVKFRKNALITSGEYQFVAYYNQDSYLVLGKRALHSKKWVTLITPYQGNTKDAHNSISIAIDGAGYLHVAWDHHDTSLRYAIGKKPFELELGDEKIMTGMQEDKVTYPQFYNLPNGNLLFFYRSGKSGRGNLVVNTYDVSTKKWTQLHDNLIDGEEERSAYWQACVDIKGTIHISWVWRESWDVETNHDMCYARSLDGGKTWEKSTGETYKLPITLETAEYAWKIPQKSSLINQTSMTADVLGNPFIANYWNDKQGIPQFQIVYYNEGTWKKLNTGFRDKAFILGGGGTKRIPISRPSIIVEDLKKDKIISILFRDEDRQNKVSLAHSLLKNNSWEVIDLTEESVGQWEPNYDESLWNTKKRLDIFIQDVTQIDGEGLSNSKPSEVKVLSIKNIKKLTNNK